MKAYEAYLKEAGYKTTYIESTKAESDVRKLVSWLKSSRVETIYCADPSDDWLRQRLRETAEAESIKLETEASPMFMNTLEEINNDLSGREHYRQTEFYIAQRKRHGILLEEEKSPVGGKWSFDTENRSKYPKDKTSPPIRFPEKNKFYAEAEQYVEQNFSGNYGRLDTGVRFPVTHDETRRWLDNFLKERFAGFGDFQDAIVRDESFLHHSLLSPMLNIGLITPGEVLDRARAFSEAEQNDVPLNSLEGFVRQILGWREFLRGLYELEGRRERTSNFWGFSRKIPPSFWEGTTGIEPVDVTIRKVLDTGYCHHIERLMILGNFMLLCEFDPDEVYRWFMELFIDAYDWVMVPNVYGMSQFADGGLLATKPYISSSNYVLKMSDYGNGDWKAIWDGLFWRFMRVHRSYLEQNQRMRMLIATLDRMDDEKINRHMENAEHYLQSLDS